MTSKTAETDFPTVTSRQAVSSRAAKLLAELAPGPCKSAHRQAELSDQDRVDVVEIRDDDPARKSLRLCRDVCGV